MGQNAIAKMRALVVYESIYGNTRAVAESIAEGLEPLGSVEAKSVYETADSDPDGVDLLVVGGPTHMHGLSSSLSRRLAIQAGEEDIVEIEPGARDQRGLRQWLAERSGPESFLVEDAEGPLAPGELERARAWGAKLAAAAQS